MTMVPGILVVHEPEQSRYDIYVGDERVGHAQYLRRDGIITFTHTLTKPTMRGRGIAARVVQQALDDARAEGLRVVPRCWYVGQFIDQHPEYRDLLA